MKTKRHNDRIRRHHELAVGTGTGRRHDHPVRQAAYAKANTAGAPVRIQHQLNRLNVKFKFAPPLRAFSPLFDAHIGLIAAISAGDVSSAMSAAPYVLQSIAVSPRPAQYVGPRYQ